MECYVWNVWNVPECLQSFQPYSPTHHMHSLLSNAGVAWQGLTAVAVFPDSLMGGEGSGHQRPLWLCPYTSLTGTWHGGSSCGKSDLG